MTMSEELKLVQEWDKVFPQSEKVNHRKVTFKNHFGITLVADMQDIMLELQLTIKEQKILRQENIQGKEELLIQYQMKLHNS